VACGSSAYASTTNRVLRLRRRHRARARRKGIAASCLTTKYAAPSRERSRARRPKARVTRRRLPASRMIVVPSCESTVRECPGPDAMTRSDARRPRARLTNGHVVIVPAITRRIAAAMDQRCTPVQRIDWPVAPAPAGLSLRNGTRESNPCSVSRTRIGRRIELLPNGSNNLLSSSCASSAGVAAPVNARSISRSCPSAARQCRCGVRYRRSRRRQSGLSIRHAAREKPHRLSAELFAQPLERPS
jgi:hypothetical protein